MENPPDNTLYHIKNLSNKDLYDILEFPEDYKPHLFELAEAELKERNLSEKEKEDLQIYYQEKKNAIQKNKEDIAKREQAFKDWFKRFHPRGENPGLARIYLLCIGLAGIFLFLLPDTISTYSFYFIEGYELDVYLLEAFLSPIFLLLAIGGFLLKHKFAWPVAMIFLTYKAIDKVFFLFWDPFIHPDLEIIVWFSAAINISWFLVYSVLIGLLLSKSVIEILRISNIVKWISILIPISLYLILYWNFIFPEKTPQLKMQDKFSIELDNIQSD